MEEKDPQKNDLKGNSGNGSNWKTRDIDQLASSIQSWSKRNFTLIKKTRVATWKGAALLAFFSGVVIATVWGFSASIFQGSLAGMSTSLLLDPPADTVQVGDTFDLDAVINSDNEDIVAVKAIINYDPVNFELQNVDTSNSTFAVGNTCQYQGKACEIIDRDDANGKVTITLAKPSPGINTASGIIATLTFQALQETSPGADNFTFSYSALGNYADSDMIVDDGNGTDTLDTVIGARITVTPTPPPACTDFTYSAWGDCQPDNTQARTVVTSSPDGCTGGSPDLTQACTYVPPTCTDFTYSAWGACQPDSTQSRTVTSSLPEGCTGGNPTLSQDCIYSEGPETCTDFIYSAWGDCQPDNTQARTVVTSSPDGCSGGSPVLSQSCVYTPPITACTSFTYTDWSACSADGDQTRSVAASSPEGCTGGSPLVEQDCTPAGETEDDVSAGTIDEDSPIKVGGEKQKFGKSDSFFSTSRRVTLKGGSSRIANGAVKIYVNGDLKKEFSANGSGDWSTKVKVSKDGNFDFKVQYYDSNGNNLGNSNKYTVKVDTKDPDFTDLPLFLNKKRGDKIWWKAEDNRKIDHFRIEFLGKAKNTTRYSFNVPADAPRGLHILRVRAYDKAGNRATRTVTIMVR